MNHASPSTPPQNLEAEAAVLGSLLLDPQRALPKLQSLLRPQHFYLRKHRWIYEACLSLHVRRDPLDFLTLTTELKQQERLAAVGGGAYVSQLINSVPSAINVEAYARHVHEAYIRRQILQRCSEAARLAHDTQRPIEEITGAVEARFLQLRDDVAHEDRLRPLHAALEDLYDEAHKLYAGETTGDLPTGLDTLDGLLDGGLHPGTLTFVAARPGVGKSILLGNLALHTVQQGRTAVLFSLEMPDVEVAARLVLRELGLNYRHLKDEDWPAFSNGLPSLADLPLWIDDTPALSIEDLVTKVRRLYAEHDLGLVLLDYTQLATTARTYPRRYQALGHISHTLKALAQELRIPVVAAAQLGREADHRRPVLGDLRESGDLEQDADILIFLHRPNGPAPGAPLVETEIIVAKHRQGQEGQLTLALHRPQLRFVPLVEEA
jgi:replicative DNA helicase